MTQNAKHLITVCAVMRNDQAIIEDFVKRLTDVLAKEFSYYEILLIDNYSSDNMPQLIQQLQLTIPNLRCIRMSRIYSLETAYIAALDNSIGDYVIVLEPLYDPIEFIPTLFNEIITSNTDIVVVRDEIKQRYNRLDLWFADLTYKIVNYLLVYPIKANDLRFRVYSRRAVNALSQVRRKHRYLKYSNALIGYSQAYIALPEHLNIARKPVKRFEAFSLLIDLIISNSVIPLRSATLLGLLASFLSLLYIIYVFITSLIKKDIIEGWLTTNLVMVVLFFLLFLILTILSEYITQLIEETRDEPLYFIEAESSSRVTTYSQLKSSEKAVNIVDS